MTTNLLNEPNSLPPSERNALANKIQGAADSSGKTNKEFQEKGNKNQAYSTCAEKLIKKIEQDDSIDENLNQPTSKILNGGRDYVSNKALLLKAEQSLCTENILDEAQVLPLRRSTADAATRTKMPCSEEKTAKPIDNAAANQNSSQTNNEAGRALAQNLLVLQRSADPVRYRSIRVSPTSNSQGTNAYGSAQTAISYRDFSSPENAGNANATNSTSAGLQNNSATANSNLVSAAAKNSGAPAAFSIKPFTQVSIQNLPQLPVAPINLAFQKAEIKCTEGQNAEQISTRTRNNNQQQGALSNLGGNKRPSCNFQWTKISHPTANSFQAQKQALTSQPMQNSQPMANQSILVSHAPSQNADHKTPVNLQQKETSHASDEIVVSSNICDEKPNVVGDAYEGKPIINKQCTTTLENNKFNSESLSQKSQRPKIEQTQQIFAQNTKLVRDKDSSQIKDSSEASASVNEKNEYATHRKIIIDESSVDQKVIAASKSMNSNQIGANQIEYSGRFSQNQVEAGMKAIERLISASFSQGHLSAKNLHMDRSALAKQCQQEASLIQLSSSLLLQANFADLLLKNQEPLPKGCSSQEQQSTSRNNTNQSVHEPQLVNSFGSVNEQIGKQSGQRPVLGESRTRDVRMECLNDNQDTNLKIDCNKIESQSAGDQIESEHSKENQPPNAPNPPSANKGNSLFKPLALTKSSLLPQQSQQAQQNNNQFIDASTSRSHKLSIQDVKALQYDRNVNYADLVKQSQMRLESLTNQFTRASFKFLQDLEQSVALDNELSQHRHQLQMVQGSNLKLDLSNNSDCEQVFHNHPLRSDSGSVDVAGVQQSRVIEQNNRKRETKFLLKQQIKDTSNQSQSLLQAKDRISKSSCGENTAIIPSASNLVRSAQANCESSSIYGVQPGFSDKQFEVGATPSLRYIGGSSINKIMEAQQNNNGKPSIPLASVTPCILPSANNHSHQPVSGCQNANSVSAPQQTQAPASSSAIQQSRAPGKNGPRKKRTIRRTAGQIHKEFRCFFCDKMYGSEAAAVMHMRNKHEAGTKQDIERDTGISVREGLLHAEGREKEWLRSQVVLNQDGEDENQSLSQ